MGDQRFVVVTGIVIPAIILVAILFMSLRATVALQTPEADLTVRIIGHQWWWEVRYPEQGIITANEIYIPAGEPVRLELTSGDVIHSFWVPNLMGKMDLVPGRTNIFWLQSHEPGRFRAQCAEYCGLQHALMGMWVVVLPREEFAQWIADQLRSVADPQTELEMLGQRIFFESPAGCHACHAIRDTDAVARLAPDLTHIASRLSLGAATIPNTRENLLQWILDPQPFKPGNLMPPTKLSRDEAEALVEYLMTLE